MCTFLLTVLFSVIERVVMNVSVLTSDKYFHLKLDFDGLRRFGLEPEKVSNLGKSFELMFLILSYAVNHLSISASQQPPSAQRAILKMQVQISISLSSDNNATRRWSKANGHIEDFPIVGSPLKAC